MSKLTKVLGVNKVIRALKKRELGYALAVETSLKQCGLRIQAASQRIVPVDTGALRNSAGTRAEGSGFNTEVFIFYNQFYAIYVHENLDAQHAPGKQAKYLEQPFRELRGECMKDIKRAMRKGGGSGPGRDPITGRFISS